MSALELHRHRNFGFLLGVIFVVIGIYPRIRFEQPLLGWALICGIGVTIVAIVAPQWLRRPCQVWMSLGRGLGWINIRMILILIFIFLVVPIGILRRILGHDPLKLSPGLKPEKIRVPCSPRPAGTMKKQS